MRSGQAHMALLSPKSSWPPCTLSGSAVGPPVSLLCGLSGGQVASVLQAAQTQKPPPHPQGLTHRAGWEPGRI